MNRNKRSLKRDVLTVITVAAVAGLVQAGSVSAENGKGNGAEAGQGKPPEEILLLKKGGNKNKIEQGGEASGAVASSLRHLNGPAHASDIAMERANERSNLGQARSYRTRHWQTGIPRSNSGTSATVCPGWAWNAQKRLYRPR